MGPFWVQISHILIILDPPYKFFEILHNFAQWKFY